MSVSWFSNPAAKGRNVPTMIYKRSPLTLLPDVMIGAFGIVAAAYGAHALGIWIAAVGFALKLIDLAEA